MRIEVEGKIMKCPRCQGEEFKEIDCGPDSDIFYTSEICNRCGLYHSGWTDKWLIDCENWRDEEDAKEFSLSKTQAKWILSAMIISHNQTSSSGEVNKSITIRLLDGDI